MEISRMVGVLKKAAVDNSPMLLTGMAVAGVFTTTVLAVRATPEALMEISYADEDTDEPLTVKDKVLATWTLYIPAVVSGCVTVGCIIGANKISSKRNAALVSIYSLAQEAAKEYRSKVVETIGDVKEKKIREQVAEDRLKGNPVNTSEIIITGSGEQLCYDSYTGRYFKSDIETIRHAQNTINAQVISDMCASQNEFYDLIGLSSASFGEEVGWTTDNLLEIIFSSHLSEDGRPCLSLDYRVNPVRGYYKIH
jgi:hypothetical protein